MITHRTVSGIGCKGIQSRLLHHMTLGELEFELARVAHDLQLHHRAIAGSPRYFRRLLKPEYRCLKSEEKRIQAEIAHRVAGHAPASELILDRNALLSDWVAA
jgi:hypothetical protein